MKKNKITDSDFKLRLFIDTNVLVDHIEGFNEKKSVTFMKLFQQTKSSKRSKIANIELITSDYVLWEFYGRCRRELYVKKLVENHNYGYIHANNESQKDNFKKAGPGCMKVFGEKMEEYIENITGNTGSIYLNRLIGKHNPGFSEFIDKVLKCSKFSYKDAIVFVSALFTHSNKIITCDEDFGEDKKKQLEKVMKDCPIKDAELSFGKPVELSSRLLKNSHFLKKPSCFRLFLPQNSAI